MIQHQACRASKWGTLLMLLSLVKKYEEDINVTLKRLQHSPLNKVICSYLNINYIRNKFDDQQKRHQMNLFPIISSCISIISPCRLHIVGNKGGLMVLVKSHMMMIHQCTLGCQSYVVDEVPKTPLLSSCLVLKVWVLAGCFSCGISHRRESSRIDTSRHPLYHRRLPCIAVAFCHLVKIYCHCFMLLQCPIFHLPIMVLECQFYATDNVLNFSHQCFLFPYYMKPSNPLTDHHVHGYAHNDCLFSHSSSKQWSNC